MGSELISTNERTSTVLALEAGPADVYRQISLRLSERAKALTYGIVTLEIRPPCKRDIT